MPSLLLYEVRARYRRRKRVKGLNVLKLQVGACWQADSHVSFFFYASTECRSAAGDLTLLLYCELLFLGEDLAHRGGSKVNAKLRTRTKGLLDQIDAGSVMGRLDWDVLRVWEYWPAWCTPSRLAAKGKAAKRNVRCM